MSQQWPLVPFAQMRLVHLGVNPQGLIPEGGQDALERYLSGLGGDWYRYASQNYVLWTDRDLAQLAREIVAIPLLSGYYVLATEFNPGFHTCNGWLPQAFWDWLGKHKR